MEEIEKEALLQRARQVADGLGAFMDQKEDALSNKEQHMKHTISHDSGLGLELNQFISEANEA